MRWATAPMSAYYPSHIPPAVPARLARRAHAGRAAATQRLAAPGHAQALWAGQLVAEPLDGQHASRGVVARGAETDWGAVARRRGARRRARSARRERERVHWALRGRRRRRCRLRHGMRRRLQPLGDGHSRPVDRRAFARNALNRLFSVVGSLVLCKGTNSSSPLAVRPALLRLSMTGAHATAQQPAGCRAGTVTDTLEMSTGPTPSTTTDCRRGHVVLAVQPPAAVLGPGAHVAERVPRAPPPGAACSRASKSRRWPRASLTASSSPAHPVRVGLGLANPTPMAEGILKLHHDPAAIHAATRAEQGRPKSALGCKEDEGPVGPSTSTMNAARGRRVHCVFTRMAGCRDEPGMVTAPASRAPAAGAPPSRYMWPQACASAGPSAAPSPQAPPQRAAGLAPPRGSATTSVSPAALACRAPGSPSAQQRLARGHCSYLHFSAGLRLSIAQSKRREPRALKRANPRPWRAGGARMLPAQAGSRLRLTSLRKPIGYRLEQG